MKSEIRQRSFSTGARSVAVILAFVALALAVTYAPALHSNGFGLLLGFYDRWAYFAPMSYYLDYSVHQGSFPAWNPLISCGAPFAANPQAMAFYPPQLLRSLLTLHPSPRNAVLGMAVLTLLHLLLAGVATFRLGRAHDMTRVAAMTAAMAFVCGAAVTRRTLDVPSFIYIIAWLPVLLLLIHGSVLKNSLGARIRYAVGAGVVLALCALAGFPQFAIYTALCGFVYGGCLHIGRARVLGLNRFWERLPWDLVLLVSVFLIGAFLAAPLLVPAAEYADHSARSKAIGQPYEYLDFRISPLYLLRGLIEYPGVTWAGSCGIRMAGAGVFLLALAACWHPRRRHTLVFATLFLVMLDCALAPQLPIGRLISWLAPFRVESPARASLYACFMFAMLAGFGVDAVTWALPSRRQTIIRAGLLLVVGAGTLKLLWPWVVNAPFVPVSRIVWFIPAILVGLMTFAPLLASGSRTRTRLVRVLLAVLVFAELTAWNVHYVPHLAGIYPYPGAIENLAFPSAIPLENRRAVACCSQRHDPSDAAGSLENLPLCQNQAMMLLAPSMGGYDPLFLVKTRNFVCGPGNETSYYRELTPREATERNTRGLLLLKRRFWLAEQYVDGPPPGKDTLFPPTTTTFLREPGTLPLRKASANAVGGRAVSSQASPQALGLNGMPSEIAITGSVPEGGFRASLTLPKFNTASRHSALSILGTATGDLRITPQFRDPRTGCIESGYAHLLHAGTKELEFALPDFADTETVLQLHATTAGATFRLLKATVLADDQADENARISIRESTPNSVAVHLADLPGPRALTFVESAYPGWTATVDGAPAQIYEAFDAFQAIVVPQGTHEVRFEFKSPSLRQGLTISAAAALVCILLMAATRLRLFNVHA